MKSILLSLVLAGLSFGQTFSFGVIGGVPFTDVINGGPIGANNSVANNASRYTLGPSVQVSLPLGLRVEVDALYRPYGFNEQGASYYDPATNTTYAASTMNISASQWRFPVLLQYRFHAPVVRPFVEVGPSFEHLTGVSSSVSFFEGAPHTTDVGIVLGGGVDMKVLLVRASAEVRYTREAVSNFSNISNRNQAEILFGIHF